VRSGATPHRFPPSLQFIDKRPLSPNLRFLNAAIGIYTYIYMSSCNLFVSFVLRVSCLGLFFECFPYVCPEPVLVKRPHLCINGSKRSFSDVMELVFAKLRCVIVFRRVICSRCLVRRASCRRTRPPVDSVPSIRRRELSLSIYIYIYIYITEQLQRPECYHRAALLIRIFVWKEVSELYRVFSVFS
jgi:hypothetical protein